MRRGALAGAVLALLFAATQTEAQPPAATGKVRTLFVGIDRYTHSADNDHGVNVDPTFLDLRGAVADVNLMKFTLTQPPYALDIHPEGATAPDGTCAPLPDVPQAVSITLTDGCATRDRILGALDALIDSADPGDLVLFYYAGHGSQRQSQSSDHPSGLNDTLVPSDAKRPPDADQTRNDIIDEELKNRIDVANGVGVSVVTIFDACHSGTDTRDVMARAGGVRNAPLTTPPIAQDDDTHWTVTRAHPPFNADLKPYRIHMAAAGDAEESHDTVAPTPPDGIFTLALTDTLNEHLPGATYLDIAAETRLKLEQFGHPGTLSLDNNLAGAVKAARKTLKDVVQNSQEEGDLTAAFLGAKPPLTREYAAEAAGSGAASILLYSGTLSGVTEGSTFAVYRNSTEADGVGAKPLATGQVSRATASCASLDLAADQLLPKEVDRSQVPDANSDPSGCAAGTAGKSRHGLWVKETSHAYGAQALGIQIVGSDPAQVKQVKDALTAQGGDHDYVQIIEADQAGRQLFISVEDNQAWFENAEHSRLPKSDPLGISLSDPQFADRVAQTTLAVANYFALLALRGDGARQWGAAGVFAGGQQVPDCPAAGASASPASGGTNNWSPEVSVPPGDVDVVVCNTSTASRNVYVLFLDSQTYQVSVIWPEANAIKDATLGFGQSATFHGRFERAGRGKLLVLFTAEGMPINIAALRQEPARDVAARQLNPLERLLLHASVGQRDTTAADLPNGDWRAMVVNVTVKVPADQAQGGTP